MGFDFLEGLRAFRNLVRVHVLDIIRQMPFPAQVGAEQSSDVRLNHGCIILITLLPGFFLKQTAEWIPAVPAVLDQEADDFPPACFIAVADDGKKTAITSS